MATYPYFCEACESETEVVEPMRAEHAKSIPCACGGNAMRTYPAPQAVIDGESSGYYPREWGFPKDPTNPMKSIAPARLKAKDAMKRANDETRGRVAAADA